MNVESLKRWHWAIVGLLIGAGLGYARLMTAAEAMVGGPGFIAQEAFEREVVAPLLMSRPRIIDVTVGQGPVANLDYVRMQRLVKGDDPTGWTYAAATLVAPRPYVVRPSDAGGATRTYPTVLEYVRSLQAGGKRVDFRYAWWTSHSAVIAMWAIGGAVLVGGGWPYLLRLLIGAGFGKPVQEPEYDLDRFKGEGETVGPKSEGMTDEDEAKLRELE